MSCQYAKKILYVATKFTPNQKMQMISTHGEAVNGDVEPSRGATCNLLNDVAVSQQRPPVSSKIRTQCEMQRMLCRNRPAAPSLSETETSAMLTRGRFKKTRLFHCEFELQTTFAVGFGLKLRNLVRTVGRRSLVAGPGAKYSFLKGRSAPGHCD